MGDQWSGSTSILRAGEREGGTPNSGQGGRKQTYERAKHHRKGECRVGMHGRGGEGTTHLVSQSRADISWLVRQLYPTEPLPHPGGRLYTFTTYTPPQAGGSTLIPRTPHPRQGLITFTTYTPPQKGLYPCGSTRHMTPPLHSGFLHYYSRIPRI